MAAMKTSLASCRIAIVVGQFNHLITDSLLKGALEAIEKQGIKPESIKVVKVPGAFEIPLACQKLAKTNQYTAILALGAVIRGATPHFDFVCDACSRGVMDVSLRYDIPIGFGVLTTNTIEQAIERAGTKAGNKGREAAMVALEMIEVLADCNEASA